MYKTVSVIIPTYNRAQLISQAIESVKAQSYPAIQLIIADDGSTDNTEEIVARFEGVEYYRQENKGQAAARNLGLRHVTGDYVASLDSDDIWQKDFLKDAVTALERYQTDFVFLNWTEIFDDKELKSHWSLDKRMKKYESKSVNEWVLLNPEEVRELFLNMCPAPSSSLLIRRSSMVSGWNEVMKIADDWYLILELVLTQPCRAACTFTPHWLKRINRNSVYHGREILDVTEDLGFHDEPIFARDFKDLLTDAEKRLLKRRLAAHHINFGRLHWKRSGFSLKALRYIAIAFKIDFLGSINHIATLTLHHLKYRFSHARAEKQFDNNLIG